MSAGVKGGFASLSKFAADLRALPRTTGQEIARRAAPKITELARATWAASQTPYGVPWQPTEDGQRATLRQTGAMFAKMFYVAIGTKLRVSLGVPYAKFQIGRRPVFPTQGGQLPLSYVTALSSIASDYIRRFGR